MHITSAQVLSAAVLFLGAASAAPASGASGGSTPSSAGPASASAGGASGGSPSSSPSGSSSSSGSSSPSESSSSSSSSSGGGAQIVIKNQCGYDVHVGQLNNGQGGSAESQIVSSGSSKNYPVRSNWQGRFWGLKDCSGSNCTTPAGAAQPASLAEFTLKGAGGNDFYDVSLVDGFNLPIGIAPINGNSDSAKSSSGGGGNSSSSSSPSGSASAPSGGASGQIKARAAPPSSGSGGSQNGGSSASSNSGGAASASGSGSAPSGSGSSSGSGGGAQASGQYICGSPTCGTLPTCPDDLQVKQNGEVVGCQSACSKYNTEEYCCSGSHSTPGTCSPNKYSQAVKSACPDAYSYAYDDKTSTYQCQASGYTVTFCPGNSR